MSWTVTDPESAVTDQNGCGSTTLTIDTASATLACSASSAGGPAQESVTIKRDATAPTLNPTVSPNPVALGAVATVDAGTNYAISGKASETCGSVVTSTVGAGLTVSCTATDLAGNSATASATYAVVNAFRGFQSPLPKTKLAKSTATIPVKFTIGNNSGSQSASTATVRVGISDSATATFDAQLTTSACTYSATLAAYQCSLKRPQVVTGRTYYLTVFQQVPGGTGAWYRLPNGQNVANTNGEPITFK